MRPRAALLSGSLASILLTLISAPDTAGGRQALALADSLAAEGHRLTVCCLQDAIILGSNRAPGDARAVLDRLLDRGARCLVLLDDLVLRGLAAGERAVTVDRAGIVAALTADHDRVIGAF